jgi:hypothetical protein
VFGAVACLSILLGGINPRDSEGGEKDILSADFNWRETLSIGRESRLAKK